MDHVEGVDDIAMTRPVIVFGIGVRFEQRVFEVGQRDAMERIGTTAIAVGNACTDRPRGERRDRTHGSEDGEHHLAEDSRQQARTRRCDPCADQRRQGRRSVCRRWIGDRDHAAGKSDRRRRAAPDHAAPRVSISRHDAACGNGCHRRFASMPAQHQAARTEGEDAAGRDRMARAAGDPVERHRERTGQLGERRRTIGTDVEHAMVQLDPRIVDPNHGRCCSTHGVAALGQRCPALACRPDGNGDGEAVVWLSTRGLRHVHEPIGLQRRSDRFCGDDTLHSDRRSHAEPHCEQPVMRNNGPIVDRQGGGRRKVERPRKIGHRVGGRMGVDDEARAVWSRCLTWRNDRVVHAATVGGQFADGEPEQAMSQPPEYGPLAHRSPGSR